MRTLTSNRPICGDTSARPITLSACIEMLFRTERPGDLRDRLLVCRDLLRERGGSFAMTSVASSARLLARRGERDPYAARVRACKEMGGIDAVEFWSWRRKDIGAIERALDETGLGLAAFLSEPAGRLVDPGTHAAFLAGLRDSVTVAQRLGARSLIVLAGDALPGIDRGTQRAAVVAALTAATSIAEDAGVTLVLEPLNTRVDHPGSFLDRTKDGLDVVAEVGSPGVRLLYDVYHSVTMGEDPERLFDGGLGALVGHVHVADAPGRHEPGSGRIAWDRVLRSLRGSGYAGPIGLEFLPSNGRTAQSLGSKAMGQVRSAAAAAPRKPTSPRRSEHADRVALGTGDGGRR